MEVKFHITPEFERMAKPLAKKYKSFEKDYDTLLSDLEKDPMQGSSLGRGIYKVRMAIAAKGKGKSGGVRVLTYHVSKITDDIFDITLLSIYDKSDIGNVSDSYIKEILKQVR